jgi:hypothetical protein
VKILKNLLGLASIEVIGSSGEKLEYEATTDTPA